MIDERQGKLINTPPISISNPTMIRTSTLAATLAALEEEISSGVPEIPLIYLHKVFQRAAREHGIHLA